MNEDTWQRLEAQFTEFPVTKAEGVSEEEIDWAAAELGISFPEDYREFLQRYGGGIVGPYPILGVRKAGAMGNDTWSVVRVTEEYRSDNWPGVETWLIISVDHAGNPMGIADDGHVWISDHDFGDISPIAENFEDFLRKHCLNV